MAKAALGKGLGALITTRPASPIVSPTPAVEAGERVQMVPLARIVPSPFQPRTVFRDEHLDELVGSIREHGIIQPLIVRARGDTLEIIAGERRWRAAQRVGLATAPIIVREASDRDVLELALIENLQREDLNPIEEARAFARLAREFNLRQEDIAQKVGKSRAAVANSMRLLDLDEEVQGWLTQDRISVGHAKVLLSLKSHEEQRALADEIIRRSLTVRAAEKTRRQPLCQQRYYQTDTQWQQWPGPLTRRSSTCKAACSSTSPRTSYCIMAKSAGALKSTITATMTCNASWSFSGCRRKKRERVFQISRFRSQIGRDVCAGTGAGRLR
jgi:ParB family chromosome partitioning protein